MTSPADSADSLGANSSKHHDRYLLREGHVFGGVAAGLLMRWSPWAFLGWFTFSAALWIYDLWTHE